MENPQVSPAPASNQKFSSYQKLVVGILVFLQFTIILDFMILSPLGAILMPAFQITPQEFGFVVSIYAFSAGIAGFLASGFADRYDRKKLLMFFYVGFLVGTLLCALATSYYFLLFARLVTGVFGGVLGSVVFAIVTDLFPFEMRGRVMGFVQTAFAVSQVFGLPFSLYLSNVWGWHAPFVMIVLLGLVAGVIIFIYLKPIDEHLKLQTDRKAMHHLAETISTPLYLQAFLTTALLSTGGFMIMPFASAFTVNNMGIAVSDLPLIYMVTGLCAMVTGPLVGRASDQFGKMPIFIFGTLLSILMVSIYTRMDVSPLYAVIIVNAVLFIGIFSRMIPSQALMSSVPEPRSRGAFMSVSSSLQQISGGVASALAGFIVIQQTSGKIERFDILGNVVCGAAILTLVMMFMIAKKIPKR
ncbi:MAG: MFS transporter [Bdellovibrionales bacterium]